MTTGSALALREHLEKQVGQRAPLLLGVADLGRAHEPIEDPLLFRRRTAVREGEVYQCADPGCGCELTVTKAPQPGAGGNQPPTRCCGKTMPKKS
jgi:hypothetical protein